MILLPTATASMCTGAGREGRDGGPNLQTAVALLPTVRGTTNRSSRRAMVDVAQWAAPSLEQALEIAAGILPREFETWDEVPGRSGLLPTPTAQSLNHHFEGSLLPTPTFGAYAPAIVRWEAVLGRPAPSPTEPGRDGRPRLSHLFVEWLMGLPAGHVTDPAIGLSRAQALKALGNGVVPQQAALALRMLLGLGPAPTLPRGAAMTLHAVPMPTVGKPHPMSGEVSWMD